MAISLIRELAQKQKVSLTPQLKKSIDLLQLSRYELIQKINNEIDINPFIEKDYQDNTQDSKENNIIQPDFDKDVAAIETLRDHLIKQVDELRIEKRDQAIAIAIIDSLDDSGQLIDEIEEIENNLNYKFTSAEIENVLKNIIHTLEPAGIGFRSIKECIYIQLKRKNIKENLLEIAEIILFNSAGLNIETVTDNLKINYGRSLIDKTISLIKKCDLAPGLNHFETHFILPDLIVSDANKNHVTFNNDYFPSIRIDEGLVESFKKELRMNPNQDISEKIQDAKWLLRSIKKRNETVLKVGEMICKRQYPLFYNKILEIRPLSNKNIADELKLHPSTISRILRSKYIQTPKGILPLKSLLINSVSKTRNVTPVQLMEIIKNIIESEKTKLSDQDISIILNKKGYNLARRTISKYRLKLKIPSSRKR